MGFRIRSLSCLFGAKVYGGEGDGGGGVLGKNYSQNSLSGVHSRNWIRESDWEPYFKVDSEPHEHTFYGLTSVLCGQTLLD